MLTAVWIAAALTTAAPDHFRPPDGLDAASAHPESLLQVAEQDKLSPEQHQAKQRLLEQKLSLLKTYLGSRRVQSVEAGNEEDPKARLDTVRQKEQEAADALEAGRLDLAETALDVAFQLMAESTAGSAKDPKNEQAKAEKAYPRLRSRVESYLSGLQGLEDGQNVLQQNLYVSIAVQDKLSQAAKAAKKNRFLEANAILEEAHDTAVRAIAEMRAGQTLFMSLNFSSPQDEYDYEVKRHESYQMLVEIARQDEVGMTPRVVAAITRFEEKSLEFEEMARGYAGKGNYEDAIPAMEEATRNLVRALQATGLPIPE